jgi:hypothetical protein
MRESMVTDDCRAFAQVAMRLHVRRRLRRDAGTAARVIRAKDLEPVATRADFVAKTSQAFHSGTIAVHVNALRQRHGLPSRS